MRTLEGIESLPGEEWCDYPGWEGLYAFSNLGRAASYFRPQKRRAPGYRSYPSRILKPRRRSGGYLAVSLHEGGRVENVYVHRGVVAAFDGPIPKGLVVDHIDGNRRNNRKSNLECVTQVENVRRSFRAGKSGASRLSPTDVLAIYSDAHRTHDEIAEEFDVSSVTVSRIRSGRAYRSITSAAPRVIARRPKTPGVMPLRGWESICEVSICGIVRTIDRAVPNGRGGLRRCRSKELVATFSRGVLYVGIPHDNQQTKMSVGECVLSSFVGPRPRGMVVRHLDGNPRNNHLDNLAWGTQSANMRDAVRHGTHPGLKKNREAALA